MTSRSMVAFAFVCACGSRAPGASVPIADGALGIGFDDLRYSAAQHRILAPAGRAGTLALVDPDTLAVTNVSGFQGTSAYDGRHDHGPTSVDEGRGFLFVTDRSSGKLNVVDPRSRTIVASVGLATGPDYVRYVQATDEVWISEPSAAQIEVFALDKGPIPTPTSTATIPVTNGPESLVIDQSHGRAYTHRWQASTVILDVRTRAAVAEWPNGCASSRGLAVDEARGFFLVGCLEGTAAVLDIAHDGRVLSSVAKGSGFDVIGYGATLGHLYLAGSSCGCLVTLGVSAAGTLSYLGRVDAPHGTHCATADDRGHVWICDPDGGQLFRVDDPYPVSF